MSQVRILLGEPIMIYLWGDWGIAKSVKARDFDSRIRWFESSYPSQIWFTSSVGRAPDF